MASRRATTALAKACAPFSAPATPARLRAAAAQLSLRQHHIRTRPAQALCARRASSLLSTPVSKQGAAISRTYSTDTEAKPHKIWDFEAVCAPPPPPGQQEIHCKDKPTNTPFFSPPGPKTSHNPQPLRHHHRYATPPPPPQPSAHPSLTALSVLHRRPRAPRTAIHRPHPRRNQHPRDIGARQLPHHRRGVRRPVRLPPAGARRRGGRVLPRGRAQPCRGWAGAGCGVDEGRGVPWELA